MKCNVCQSEISDQSSFCCNCGARVTSVKLNKCPDCNAEIEDGLMFCSNCGLRLHKVTSKIEPNIEAKIESKKEPKTEPKLESKNSIDTTISITRAMQFVCCTNSYKVIVNGHDLGKVGVGKTLFARVTKEEVTVDIICTTILIKHKIRIVLKIEQNPRIDFEVEWPGAIKALVYNADIVSKTTDF